VGWVGEGWVGLEIVVSKEKNELGRCKEGIQRHSPPTESHFAHAHTTCE
jgi:hypothetical protein